MNRSTRRRTPLAALLATAMTTVSLFAMHASNAQAASPANIPTILIHGFDGGNVFEADLPLDSATDCQAPTMSKWNTGLRDQGLTNIFTVGYYKGDKNCSFDIPNKQLVDINTPINQIAELLAQAIETKFPDQKVAIIGHSMGGVILRRMVTSIERGEYGSRMQIPDAVTVASPHRGSNWPLCLTVVQCQQLSTGSALLSGLIQNPQAPGGTDWTVIGSTCDLVVSGASETFMSNGAAGRPPVFKKLFGNPPCFDHIAMITQPLSLRAQFLAVTTNS